MTGRRLLDIAAIFKASQGVAAKHVALRQHQLDVYSKTSSLAKAVKSQTDRVTLTVKAASVLAERFNGPEPDYSTQASQPRKSTQGAPIPSQDGASGTTEGSVKKDGLSQDHFYERPDQNAAADPPPDANLGVRQEKAKRYPLPDGSILPADTAEVPERDKYSYNELPQTEPAKAPLADGREETDEGLQPTLSGRTSIPNPTEGTDPVIAEKSKTLQRQAEKRTLSQAVELSPPAHSEELDLKADQDWDVFYTPLSSDGRVHSALPRVTVPKNTEDAQESDKHVSGAQINQDVFSSSPSKNEERPVPQAQAVPEQEQLSDEAYTELFHSPRVARMLGGHPKPSKPLHEKDQVSSSVRTSGQESQDGAQNPPAGIVDSTSSQAKSSEDMHDLITDIAEDAEARSADPSQASFVRDIFIIWILID